MHIKNFAIAVAIAALGVGVVLGFTKTSDFAPGVTTVSVNPETGEYCCLPGAELAVRDSVTGKVHGVKRRGFDRVMTLNEARSCQMKLIGECERLGCFEERIQALSRFIEWLYGQTYYQRWLVLEDGCMLWRFNLHPTYDEMGSVVTESDYSREVVWR